MAIVSIQNAAAYQPELLDQAIAAHFDTLNVAADLKPGMRVLLKPNLLTGRDPAHAVTTHPAVLAAVARWLKAHGISDILLADSPGGVFTPQTLKKVYTACGLDQLRPLMALNEDVTSERVNGFDILMPVLQADYIINCAKLKTHGLTVMSAGVKNLYGCIPGLKKAEWHARRPSLDSFCSMLIDLCDTVKPDLTLIDAIDCMEGNGPGGGDVRPMGMTLCSRNPYALDEQAALLMGLTPQMAPIVTASRKRGKLDDPTILMGDPLVPAEPPFVLPDAIHGREKLLTFNGIFHRICGRGRKYPYVIPAKCVGCGKCAESCPKHLITIVDRKAQIQRKHCISCFCCQEMCPARAIEAK